MSSEAPLFTICCLFYGDYPELAERLLGSLCPRNWTVRYELRVGANQVSSATMAVIKKYVPQSQIWIGEQGLLKYPMMRRLFHDRPLGRYTMWFDDDSWILQSAPDDWLEGVARRLESHDVLGAIYYMRLRGNQHLWIADQPWFHGVRVLPRQRCVFCTGGWLAIRSEILSKHDWPPREFEHNGGDVMLGELCRQQGYKLGNFTQHLAINADSSGKCSTAKRRGASHQPVGTFYRRP